MRRVYRGYTIIEAMIVLTVSGIILSAAILTFRGQQGKTEFTQSVRDIDSKIQSAAKDIASGVSVAQGKQCLLDDSERPSLSTKDSSGSGTSSDCIYLGKAIEVQNNSDTIKIYTILGKRDAGSFTEAQPTPIGDPENYQLIGGTTVVGSTTSDFSTPIKSQSSSLVGVYLGMNSGDSDRGSAGGPLFMRGYTNSNGGICVEEDSGCGVIPQVSKWQICLQSAYNSGIKAGLIITPSSSGVTTQLSFDGCN